jgi:hypothetical protein
LGLGFSGGGAASRWCGRVPPASCPAWCFSNATGGTPGPARRGHGSSASAGARAASGGHVPSSPDCGFPTCPCTLAQIPWEGFAEKGLRQTTSLKPVWEGSPRYFWRCHERVFRRLDGWIRRRLRSLLRKRAGLPAVSRHGADEAKVASGLLCRAGAV